MDRARGKRAALWGIDSDSTRTAAQIFRRDGFLEQFLDLVWHRKG